ncbi:MAG: histidine--tRNA ligase [Candidatus Omnitrophica bacterium]|nr:histidine--tRNA ligase [Candidatus Omnitrophota bacterium]
MSKYSSLRGMPDILPEEAAKFEWIESRAREVFGMFEFREIRVPYLESTEVFTRSIGENTDIVEKEMYTFLDRGGKQISLRPEGTASIVRAYVEHNLSNKADIVKLFYIGPMFRGERPQKGRQRQFHQIGCEIIGASSPYLDADLIMSLKTFFEKLGIKDFTLNINTLGCAEDRKKFASDLSEYFAGHLNGLCENCQRRSTRNVLRVLDCKNPACKEIVKGAPGVAKNLCPDCLDNYSLLKHILHDAGVTYNEKTDLVRGLDYYTGTVFEVSHPSLGAQDALAAGGRYDNLVHEMGGPDVGATGYAVGMERLLLVIKEENYPAVKPGILIIALDEKSHKEAFKLTNKLREAGIKCDMDHSGRSLKGGMRKADKEKREKVIIIGENELASGMVVVKNMVTGEQKSVGFGETVDLLIGENAHG